MGVTGLPSDDGFDVGSSIGGGDDGDRVPCTQEMQVHEEAGGSAVAVGEGVDGDEASVDFGGDFDGVAGGVLVERWLGEPVAKVGHEVGELDGVGVAVVGACGHDVDGAISACLAIAFADEAMGLANFPGGDGAVGGGEVANEVDGFGVVDGF